MAGLLSRLTGSEDSEETGVSVRSFDHASRAALLGSLEHSDLGWFWASDPEGKIVYISQPAAKRVGKPVSDIVGRMLTDFFQPVEGSEDSGGERPLKFQLAARNSIKPVTVMLDMGEGKSWWEIAGVPQVDGKGRFGGYHGIARDVSDTFESQRDAQKMSRYDALTGLANRHRMTRVLSSTLTAFKASKRSCAMMLIDLDRFKQVNDTMGHPAGDELLKQVAGRLKRVVGDRVENEHSSGARSDRNAGSASRFRALRSIPKTFASGCTREDGRAESNKRSSTPHTAAASEDQRRRQQKS